MDIVINDPEGVPMFKTTLSNFTVHEVRITDDDNVLIIADRIVDQRKLQQDFNNASLL
jgi:hypothetical protein